MPLVLRGHLIRIRIIGRDGLGQKEELEHIIQGEKGLGQGFGVDGRKGRQPFIKTVDGEIVAVPAIKIETGLQLFMAKLPEDRQGLVKTHLPNKVVSFKGL